MSRKLTTHKYLLGLATLFIVFFNWRNPQALTSNVAQGQTLTTPPPVAGQWLGIQAVSANVPIVPEQPFKLTITVTTNIALNNATLKLDDFSDYDNPVELLTPQASWPISLQANESQAFQVLVVVHTAGVWPLEVTGWVQADGKELLDVVETLHLDSRPEAGKIIRSYEYTYSQPEFFDPSPAFSLPLHSGNATGEQLSPISTLAAGQIQVAGNLKYNAREEDEGAYKPF